MRGNFYLDTNFFIYLSDPHSPFRKNCLEFIKIVKKENLIITTSTETIQEIIFLAQKTKDINQINQIKKSLRIAKETIRIVNGILPITQTTINLYLDAVARYKNTQSRDLIHLAVCMENKIGTIVTYDRDFRKFKEIKVLFPEEIS